MHQRHDRAFLLTKEVLSVFRDVIRDDEYRDAFETVFECIRKGLAEYEVAMERRMARLKPSSN